MVSKLIVPVLAVLSLARIAAAAEYPCPSDPGFCYRDIGNDGCFDSGTDLGPINDEIEASGEFPDPVPPGSIVCPPSVGELNGAGDVYLATEPGSDVLFFGTRINSPSAVGVRSGGGVLIGGPITATAFFAIAEGDATLEASVKIDTRGDGNTDAGIHSESGDVVVGPRASIRATVVGFSAAVGDVSLLERVNIVGKGRIYKESGFIVDAGASVEATRVRFKGDFLWMTGRTVRLMDKAAVRATEVVIEAEDEVAIDRLKALAGWRERFGVQGILSIAGARVTIGVAESGGRVPRSTIAYKGDEVVTITGTDSVDIDGLALKSSTDVEIGSDGPTLNFRNGRLMGTKNAPEFRVTVGLGFTCDLTGTLVKKATLVTSCDTVVGP